MKNRNPLLKYHSINKFNRRNFLKISAIGTAGLMLLPYCKMPGNASKQRFFSDEEAKLIDALVEQIVPTDDWPGAKTAGVTSFIDKQLNGPYKRYKEKYKTGLQAVELSCKQLFSKSFIQLSWDEQTQFLKDMESGKFSSGEGSDSKLQNEGKIWEKGQDRELFQLIRDHTLQGFYGSPRHGGNKDYVSYRMIGLDYPLIIGQNRYKS